MQAVVLCISGNFRVVRVVDGPTRCADMRQLDPHRTGTPRYSFTSCLLGFAHYSARPQASRASRAHQAVHHPVAVGAKALQVLQARLVAIRHMLHLHATVMHFNAGLASFTVCGNWVHPTALTT